MSELPYITTTTDDETQILACLNKQMDEHQLFQFLNDLQEVYRAQRSQMLISPLPSVEVICDMLQQLDQHRKVLEGLNFFSNSSTLLSKNMDMRNMDVKCSERGNKGHTPDKCWHVIGFPSWHPRS